MNFLTPKNTTLKLHDLKKFQFPKHYSIQLLLLFSQLKKTTPNFFQA